MDIGKDLQEAYEQGRRDALNEIMEYTYGMLTAERFGLQHKIKSMMADRKTEPFAKDINVRSKIEPQTERHLPDYSYEADLGRRIMEQTERSK